jgi:cytochrome c
MRRLAALALALASPPAAADAQGAGERAFRKCYSCHSVDPAETGLPGPNLHGILGRPAAAEPGFDYSPALRRAGAQGLVWTAAALDRFLADPRGFLPGTLMAFVGLPDPEERRRLIRYLQAAGAP